jgi:hypothetical protein
MSLLSLISFAFAVQPAADPLDEAVLGLYSAISGPAGKERDWAGFKQRFLPEARMSVVIGEGEKGATMPLDVEGYIERAGPFLLQNGFFEREVARRVEQYGNMAHVWSTYESRMKEEDEAPFDRGINSILLVRTEAGWKIANVVWTSERTAGPIPAKYLASGR